MDAEKALHVALQANRRTLWLLDKELRRASARDRDLVAALVDAEDDIMPAFYDVIGGDGKAGISISPGTAGPNTPFYGMLNLSSDAPFVAKSLVCIQEIDGNLGGFFGPTVAPIFEENIDAGNGLDGGDFAFGLLIHDISNGSQIMSANFANGPAAQMIPIQALMGTVAGGVPGDWQVDETVFPKAASLRCEAYVRVPNFSQRAFSLRLHLILCGYKVFGE